MLITQLAPFSNEAWMVKEQERTMSNHRNQVPQQSTRAKHVNKAHENQQKVHDIQIEWVMWTKPYDSQLA